MAPGSNIFGFGPIAWAPSPRLNDGIPVPDRTFARMRAWLAGNPTRGAFRNHNHDILEHG
jgi:hypothetical protein